MSKTIPPCPPIQPHSDAPQRLLWKCAGEANDLAFWALVFTVIALFSINAVLLWWRLWKLHNL